MRLRQIALAATDLAATAAALSDVLGTGEAFRDPGVGVFGLENACCRSARPSSRWSRRSAPTPRAALDREARRRRGLHGDLQCDDLAALAREVERAKRAGAVVVWEGEHAGARTAHFHPRALGAIASLDAMPSWGEWVWAGPGWRERTRTRHDARDHGAELASPDPEKLARAGRAARHRARRARDGSRSRCRAAVGSAFVAGGEGDALVGVEIALADRARFEPRARARGVLGADGAATIAGVRFIPAELALLLGEIGGERGDLVREDIEARHRRAAGTLGRVAGRILAAQHFAVEQLR
jgi:hypothetical protein